MKSEYSEKMTLKYPPCKQPEQSCVQYDYDPCEYSDDITEKDLAVLLKEEEKLLRERKEEQKEEKNKEPKKEQNKEQKKQEEEKEKAERETLSAIPVGKLLEEKRDLPQSAKPVKKCKKVIKNPFLNNRLEFSRCLPPPPPTPPPQFFPTFEEDEVGKCTRKRKKKCEKIKPHYEDMEKHSPTERKFEKEKKKSGEKEEEKQEEKEKEEEKEENEEEKEEKDEEKKEKDEEKEEKDEEKEEKDEEKEEDEQEKEEEKEKEKKEKREEAEPEDRQKGHRKKCRKIYKSPCRKKSSLISNMFQPRPIPAHQRDLPQTSPLETPEVERQIWLSRKINCQTDCVRNNCKMTSLKKKCERKKRSREGTSND